MSAYLAIEKMIECFPEQARYSNDFDFGLMVKQSIAQELADTIYHYTTLNRVIFKKGDQFTYKGIKCIVV